MSEKTQLVQNAAMKSRSKVRSMVQIGMLSAVAIVLMLFEIPLWFAPGFYKIDLSEVAVMVGAFAMGPAAGIAIEFVKILLNLLINGTQTAGVGELANFLIGCSLVLPAAWIYKNKKTRKNAVLGMGIGILCTTAVGCILNAFLLLPAYSAAFGMPIETLVGMGSAVNKAITGLPTFVMFAVAPFNLLKGFLVSVITLLLYKKLNPILKANN